MTPAFPFFHAEKEKVITLEQSGSSGESPETEAIHILVYTRRTSTSKLPRNKVFAIPLVRSLRGHDAGMCSAPERLRTTYDARIQTSTIVPKP